MADVQENTNPPQAEPPEGTPTEVAPEEPEPEDEDAEEKAELMADILAALAGDDALTALDKSEGTVSGKQPG